jgi:hypothetical protein
MIIIYKKLSYLISEMKSPSPLTASDEDSFMKMPPTPNPFKPK